jgi:hypothetical protein
LTASAWSDIRFTGIVEDVTEMIVEHAGAVAGHPLGHREAVVRLGRRRATGDLGGQATIPGRLRRARAAGDVPLDRSRAVVTPADLGAAKRRAHLVGERAEASVGEIDGLAARLPAAAGPRRAPDPAAHPRARLEHDHVGAGGRQPVGGGETGEARADDHGVMHGAAPRPRQA